MPTTVLLLLALLFAGVVATLPAPEGPAHTFPAEVHLRNKHLTLSLHWYAALLDGKIYVKPIDNSLDWFLLPPDGLPNEAPKPTSVIEIQSDGRDLIALGDNRRAYFMRFDEGDGFHWKGGWGRPSRHIPIPENSTDWAVSQRGPDNWYYTDAGNNTHPSNIGCDGLYLLQDNHLFLVDNWSLPSFFLFEICVPRRGQTRVLAVSASASTIFLVTADRKLWTRLADFDIMGWDPVVPTTYDPTVRNNVGGPQTLPILDWQEHAFDHTAGILSSNITILQTGQGNDAREMRVGGCTRSGQCGYFYKNITDTLWQFKEVQFQDALNLLKDESPAAFPPVRDANFTNGPVHRVDDATVAIHLLDFSLVCSPARLMFDVRYANGTTAALALPLHHLPKYPLYTNAPQAAHIVASDEAMASPEWALVRHVLGPIKPTTAGLVTLSKDSGSVYMEFSAKLFHFKAA